MLWKKLLATKQGGIPTDYIAFYTMTNTSGSTLIDETGSYDMTISGAVVSGDYMDFDGVNDKCELSSAPSLTSDCAFCFWMIPDNSPSGTFEYTFQHRYAHAFAHDHSSSTVRGVGLHYNTSPAFNITTPNQAVTDTTNPTFIVYMKDSGTLYHYEGGVEIGSISMGTTNQTNTIFNIGCGHSNTAGASGQYFAGRIKYFRIYDRALTAAEIEALAAEF